jgi:hypothetical protein
LPVIRVRVLRKFPAGGQGGLSSVIEHSRYDIGIGYTRARDYLADRGRVRGRGPAAVAVGCEAVAVGCAVVFS